MAEQAEQMQVDAEPQLVLIPKQEEPDQNYEGELFQGQRQSLAPRAPYPGLVMTSCTRLNVVIKKAHICGEWKWLQGGEDTCGICRMEFESACNMCKFPGDECPLVVGTCRHAFHRHCIDKWISSPSNAPKAQCPLCRQDWVAAENVIEIRD